MASFGNLFKTNNTTTIDKKGKNKVSVEKVDIKPSLDRLFVDKNRAPGNVYDKIKNMGVVDSEGNTIKERK